MARGVRNSNLFKNGYSCQQSLLIKLPSRLQKRIFAQFVMANTDAELRELEELRDKLVQKAYDLRDELKNAHKNVSQSRCITIAESLSKLFTDSNGVDDSPGINKTATRLCEASKSILGIQFEDVQKNWHHDNVYRYDARVITKAIQFDLELTVDVKNAKEYAIEDINCHFANVDENYMAEVTPWIDRFTRDKQFSFLMSALCDYNKQSAIRVKILNAVKSKGYATLEKCGDNGGGILIYVHPPNAQDEIFFKIQWHTKFVDKTWRIEHIFTIVSVQADKDLVRKNKQLLESFCRIGLTKNDLEELWSKLCLVIDNNQ